MCFGTFTFFEQYFHGKNINSFQESEEEEPLVKRVNTSKVEENASSEEDIPLAARRKTPQPSPTKTPTGSFHEIFFFFRFSSLEYRFWFHEIFLQFVNNYNIIIHSPSQFKATKAKQKI